MPPLPTIRVYRSPLHGYGVLATRDFEPDEIIAEVEGVIRHKDEVEDDTYCLWLDGEHFFDMVDQTRWINHSCEPNAEVEVDLDEHGVASAHIVAVKPIRAGEEITYHYAFSQEVAEPCYCRTSSCNGWIVDPDELHVLHERLAREKAAEAKPAPKRVSKRKPAADGVARDRRSL